MDDDRKKRIIEKAAQHEGVVEAARQMTDVLKSFTEWQDGITLPILEFQRTFSELVHKINNSPIFESCRQLSGLISEWAEKVLPVINEIEHQNKLAQEEANKIPAKLNTVSDKGYALDAVEMDIMRLEKIEESCLNIISQLKHGIQFYTDLDEGVDCSEYIEKYEDNLKMVSDYLIRCRELLAAKIVQHDFLTQTDAEYQSRPKPKSLEQECHIILPAHIPDFIEKERLLVERNYLDSNLRWIADKQVLASLVQELLNCRYFKRTKGSANVHRRVIREFFEKRYSVIIVEQFKPSKVKNHSLSPSFPAFPTRRD